MQLCCFLLQYQTFKVHVFENHDFLTFCQMCKVWLDSLVDCHVILVDNIGVTAWQKKFEIVIVTSCWTWHQVYRHMRNVSRSYSVTGLTSLECAKYISPQKVWEFAVATLVWLVVNWHIRCRNCMCLHKIVGVWVDKSTKVSIVTLSSLHVGLATLNFVTGWLQMNVCIQLSFYKP